MKINEKIKVLRKIKELSTYDLSAKTGISQSTISKLENGKRKMDIEILQKIADALEVPLDYLTGESLISIIEDKLIENGMSIQELLEKAKVSKDFFDNLDHIQPDESDYRNIVSIAYVLGIHPNVLKLAFSRQAPSSYDCPTTSVSDDFGVIKESTIEKDFPIIPEHFTSPDMARAYVMKHQIFAASGFYPERMSDEDILNFANEIINQAELIGYKYKDK